MREWLKSVGQVLTGLGLLVAAFIYLLEVWRGYQERVLELVGLLELVAIETSRNNQALSRLIREPQRLISPFGAPFQTEAWDQNSVRISQLLEDYTLFSLMARYYQSLQLAREALEHGAPETEGIEELRKRVEAARQYGGVLEYRAHRYIASMLANKSAKK